jgi:hypothetical protein
MHKITFFPVGNADSCMVDLKCGKKMLFDFANFNDDNDDDEPRINLGEALRENLESTGNKHFDVVAFTHADDDHVHGASEFFYLEHAEKYRDDERIKIKDLWVPAAMILEENLKNDAIVIRAEARYRLKEGKGIKVFSRPERLKKWLEDQGIDVKDRSHLIINAGNTVTGFSKSINEVEFFVHSPFAAESDGKKIERNEASLIFQVKFYSDDKETKFLLIGDTTYDILEEIVGITRNKMNEDRLEWDIYDVPHHCSYLALNIEKGKKKTEPVEDVKWMLEKGNKYGCIISSSNPIPDNDDDDNPPHRQAANCYKEYAEKIGGQFKVTMEHSSKKKPKPLMIGIDKDGATIKLSANISVAASPIITQKPPRAGKFR